MNNTPKQLKMDLWQGVADAQLQPQRHILTPSSKNATTANELTRSIINFIIRQGWQAERISITGRPIKQMDYKGRCIGYTFGSSHMTKGTADISATIRGRSVKIEVKIGADRQSDAQRKYQADIERAGGLYYIARDFESFVEWYNMNFRRTEP